MKNTEKIQRKSLRDKVKGVVKEVSGLQKVEYNSKIYYTPEEASE